MQVLPNQGTASFNSPTAPTRDHLPLNGQVSTPRIRFRDAIPSDEIPLKKRKYHPILSEKTADRKVAGKSGEEILEWVDVCKVSKISAHVIIDCKEIIESQKEDKSCRDGIIIDSKTKYDGIVKGVRVTTQGKITMQGFVCTREFCEDNMSSFGTSSYPDGSCYEGWMQGFEKHGRGMLSYPDHTIFAGRFENDLTEARGFLRLPDGSSYYGECLNGKPHGKGTLVLPNKQTFYGHFSEGVFSGEGFLKMADRKILGIFQGIQCPAQGHITFFNGDMYEGGLEKGKMHAYGIFNTSTGLSYEGCFNEDVFHGEGLLTESNGDVYEGAFVDGKKDGYGIFRDNTDLSYEGDFKEDVFHGKGVLTNSSGDVYKGAFVDGKKDGYGIFKCKTGLSYEGDFKEDVFHGKGVLTNSSGDVHDGLSYEGEFKEGVFHGEGTLTYSNGIVYKGEFVEGKRHGQGVLKKKGDDSFTFTGSFENDQMKGKGHWKLGQNWYKGIFNDKGLLEGVGSSCIDASIYTGHFLDGLEHGLGKKILLDGTIYEGIFEQGAAIQAKVISKESIYEGALKDGLFHGQGVLQRPNYIYEGEFFKGLKHGEGQLTDSDGIVYKGGGVNGKRHGQGVLEKKGSDPSTYIGAFEEDRIKGEGYWIFGQDWYKGTFDERGLLQGDGSCYIDQSIYNGSFLNGLAHGSGRKTFPSGIIYEGTFEQGVAVHAKVVCSREGSYEGTLQNWLFHGQGVLKNANYTYSGEFYEGVMHGKGTMQFTDKKRYEGEFKGGCMHGGVMTYPNCNSYQGEYFNFQASGQGSMVFANGDVFTGEFKADQPCGRGVYKTVHGLTIEGTVVFTQ